MNVFCIIILFFVTLYFTKSKSYRTGQLGLIITSIVQGVLISLLISPGNLSFIYSVEYSVIYYIAIYYVWPMRNLFVKKNIVDYKNEDLYDLIKKHGDKISDKVQLKKLLGKNSLNAYSKTSTSKYQIIFGEELIEKFSQDELKPVLAHELSHIIKKHARKKTLFVIPLIFLIFLSIEVNKLIIFSYLQNYDIIIYSFYWISITLFFIACILVINIFSWWVEYDADKNAIKITRDSKTFINFLKKLNDELKYKDYGRFLNILIHDHPIIKSRIKRIEEISSKSNN